MKLRLSHYALAIWAIVFALYGFAGAEQQAGTAALPIKIVLEGTPEWESLKSKNPRLTARDIRTDGGVVRGTYDYGSRAA